MGLLDYADAARKKLAGLLGDMPLVQIVQGRAEMPTRAGLLGALKSIPVFSPDAGQSAYEAALTIGPMGLGKIVYHGSPHKFDKFDASKIGTGEGAQAYGHGIYLTDSPQIAEHYKKALLNEKGGHFSWEDRSGKEIDVHSLANSARTLDPRALAASALRQSESVDDALDLIGKATPDQFVGGIQEKKATIDGLLSFMRQGVAKRPGGSLIKADLPDEWIPKMLDWDKPVSSNKPLLSAMKKLGLTDGNEYFSIEGAVPIREVTGGKLMEDMKLSAHHYGDEIPWASLHENPGIAASMALREQGIPGVRYLDGGSRGKGQGSYNYVVFPGLEDQVKILERNGVPLSGLLGGK